MAKKKTTEFSDEYFLNLTMDFDKRDSEIYPKWAAWCYDSNDKYYIDGKDGKFYTAVRTDEEINIERKLRTISELLFIQSITNSSNSDWQDYVYWLNNGKTDILNFTPLTYEEWKQQK